MKKTIKFTRSKFTYLLVAFAFVVLYTSCNSEDDGPSSDINRISMKTLPQVKYVLGETLNLSDMVITVNRGEGSVDIPFSSFEAEGIITEPENGKPLELSDESVTIKFGTTGKGLIQPINVTNDVVEIRIKTEPNINYVNGQKLDLSDMVLTLVYENGDEEDFEYENIKEDIVTVPAHGDVIKATDTEVLITYGETEVQTVQELELVRFTPVRGELITTPLKSEYEIGERLDLSGTVIRFTLLNNSTVDVAFEDFESFKLTPTPANDEKLSAGRTEVNVRHVSGIQVAVPIIVNSLNVTGIEIETKPEKVAYEDGETIDLKGLFVKLIVDGSDELIVSYTDFDIYGIVATPAHGETFSEGTTEIEISYPGLADSVSISLGAETLYESDFSQGFDGWITNQNGGGSANVYEENRTIVITDIVPGANYWDVQFYKPGFTLVNGGKYKLTLVVKAYPGQGNFNFTFSVGDGDGRDGYQPYDGGGELYLVDSEYSTYEGVFTMSKADTPAARILLDIGKQSNGIIIKSVKLERI
ncbi:hypothetical protein EGM88_14095 [Aureibaculum marinum]|uniref:CBM-cenC domain-containing protein n=1 Tax=Aureibaculum marinum TaxID=2487930 RepID=A0A3N4NXA6_9FLAO|nr:carbohydrate binding domain-containing protein [Aureibaculum marinum]RPD91763.1 hypothetical protein EGM88_14095 [Aureibaculum marinum]